MAIEPQAPAAALSPDSMAALARVVREIYPHDSFPDEPYQRVAEQLAAAAAEDAGLAGTLEQGVRDLDAARGRPFVELEAGEAAAVVREASGTPFFAAVRSTAVVALYDRADVWELLGYEGPSFDRGGYVERGFDDLDWLPDPAV